MSLSKYSLRGREGILIGSYLPSFSPCRLPTVQEVLRRYLFLAKDYPIGQVKLYFMMVEKLKAYSFSLSLNYITLKFSFQ